MRRLSIGEIQSRQLNLMKELHKFLSAKEIHYYMIAGSALGAIRHGGFIPWDDDIDIGMFRKEYEKFLSVCDEFDSQYEIVNYRKSSHCDFGLTRIYFENTRIDDESIEKTKLDKRLYLDIFPLDKVPEDDELRGSFEKEINKKKKQLSYMYPRNYGNSAVAMLIKKMVSIMYAPFRTRILRRYDSLMRKYENTDTAYVCSLCSQYSFKEQVMPKSYYGTPTMHDFEDAEFYIPEQIDEYLMTLYGDDYMAIPTEGKRRKGHAVFCTDEE